METNINYDTYKSRLKNLSIGATNAMVKASWVNDKEVIIKKWPKDQKSIYLREKNIYLKLIHENYIPTIIYYDDNSLCIIIEDVGDSLKNIVIANKTNMLPRDTFLQLELIIKQMYNKYKLIHGDITFRNLCIKNNKLYLIDFDQTREIDITSFDYNNSSKWLCNQVSLITNYKFFTSYIIGELRNKRH